MYQASAEDYRVWLDQTIWHNGLLRRARKHYIPAFADSLTEFLKRKGYTMHPRWGKGHGVVGRWLYRIAVCVYARNTPNAPIQYEFPGSETARPEDIDQFYHVIPTGDIQSALERWTVVEDLDPQTDMGKRVWIELETLVWKYLDLETSRQTSEVDAFFYDSESEYEWQTNTKGYTDEYIQDSSEGYHGGRGSKV